MMNGLLQKEHGSKQAMWYIAWWNISTRDEGTLGEPIQTKRAAQARCDELNILYPNVLHWPIKE